MPNKDRPILIDTGPTPIIRQDALEYLWTVCPVLFVDLRDGSIVIANRACETLFGYSLGEMVGMCVDELVPESGRAKHAADRAAFAADPTHTARPMGEGKVVEGRHQNGGTIPVTVALYRVTAAGRRLVLCVLTDMRTGVVGHPTPGPSPGPAPAPEPGPCGPAGGGGSVARGLCLLFACCLSGGFFLFLTCGGRPKAAEVSAVANETRAAAMSAAAVDALDRGLADMRAGEHELASVSLMDAERLGADPKLCLGALAYCLFRRGLDAQALSACDRLNLSVPNAGRANWVRGLVYDRLGRRDEALNEWRLAGERGERLALTLIPGACGG